MLSELHAKVLCHGVQVHAEDQEFFSLKYSFTSDFVSGSLFKLSNRGIVNTIVHPFNGNPTVPVLRRKHDDTEVVGDGTIEAPIAPLFQPPAIRSQRRVADVVVSDYFQMHNDRTLFLSAVRECVFIAEGNRCAFCTFEEGAPRPLSPRSVGNVYSLIAQELGFSPAVAIGSGTPNKRDHGLRYHAHLVAELGEQGCTEMSVEFVPPRDVAELAILVDAGCGSLISSVEVWDQSLRARLLPGKAYVDRDHYVRTWEEGVKLLGRGKVSSVLIVGLDDARIAREAIDVMTSIGVVPTLIPYRRYDRSIISSDRTPAHGDYVELARYNAARMISAGIGPHLQVGCTGCGGCSLEVALAGPPSQWRSGEGSVVNA